MTRRHDGPHALVERHQTGTVTEARGHRGEHHHRVHRVIEPGHVVDPSGHEPARVEQQHHGLVALGAVGADDRSGGAGGGGPVDPAELVVDRVVAQRVELGAATASLSRPKTDLEDARPVDAQLGFVA